MSVTETTLYATLPMIMNVIFQNFIWGPLTDKFQHRRIFVISGEILAGAGTIIVWAIHYSFENLYLAGYVIIIGLSIVEIFWSMSNIGWSALISDIYPFKERSKIMGKLTSFGGLSRIIGIFIGGFLYDAGFGFRNGQLFFIASFIMFISALPMFLAPKGMIDVPSNPKALPIEFSDSSSDNNVISSRVFAIFIIALLFINFGRNSISIPYSQYLILESGFAVDSMLLSFIVNSRSVAVLIFGLIAGRIDTKLGHGRTLIIGTSICILALIITATANFLPMIFVGSFLIGSAEVLISVSSYTIASNLLPPEKRGKLFAIYNTTFFLSWGLSSTVISAPLIDLLLIQGVSEVFAYQMAFFIGAFTSLVGLLIFLAISKLIQK